MRKTFLFASIVVMLIAVALLCGLLFFQEDPVKTEEEALAIAVDYVAKKYEQDFSEYTVHIVYEDGYWVVFYGLEETLGGGGPELYIDSDTGRVIRCQLAQ